MCVHTYVSVNVGQGVTQGKYKTKKELEERPLFLASPPALGLSGWTLP